MLMLMDLILEHYFLHSFRHMPQLIEKGYLYIAQPPLYKVKKGSSEVYLKNEQALQNYIIDNSLKILLSKHLLVI